MKSFLFSILQPDYQPIDFFFTKSQSPPHWHLANTILHTLTFGVRHIFLSILNPRFSSHEKCGVQRWYCNHKENGGLLGMGARP